MKRVPDRSRLRALCIIGLLAAPATLAVAGYTGFGAPRIGVQAGGQTDFVRALSLCVVADSALPVQSELRIDEPGDTGARLVMQVAPGAVAPPNLRLFRGDIAGATVVEQTPTRIVLQGFAFDMTQALRTSAVLANGPGTARYTATYCNTLGVCTEVRMQIQFVGNTSAVEFSACDAPPVLRAADDNGLRGDDDYTSAQPLRFDVASSAATVTLLRDGVAIDSRPVSGGTVTLQDSSAPTATLHAYQAVHGAGAPSAARYVERHPPSLDLFSNGFEPAN